MADDDDEPGPAIVPPDHSQPSKVAWQHRDLRRARGDRPKPTLSQYLYPGRRHLYSGPPESAKTLAAYADAIAVMRTKRAVVLFDFEMGEVDALERFREMGATAEELAWLVYYEPDTPATDQTIFDVIDTWWPALMIIDAAAGAYDLQGLDDERRRDCERWARTFINPAKRRGVTTITLDHVVKNADARGKWAIGSERKVGGVDVHIGFEPITPLTRGGTGLIKLTTHRDRFGHLARPALAELHITSDPDTHSLTWEYRQPNVSDDGTSWKPTILMQRALEFLAHQTGPVSKSTIAAGIGKNKKAGLQAVDFLVLEGKVTETPGPRGAHLITLTGSAVLEPVQEPLPSSGSSGSPPQGGNRSPNRSANGNTQNGGAAAEEADSSSLANGAGGQDDARARAGVEA